MEKNNQPIEKAVFRKDGMYDVHSIFYTIQGEGPFCGVPAVFVRLAGCNLQCPGCDTDYTVGRKLMDIDQIISSIRGITTSAHLVVITGGEPFRQELLPLINTLNESGFEVQIETNGTLPPPLEIDWFNGSAHIVCSPKTGKVNPLIAHFAMAFKYVVHADSIGDDGLPLFALDHPAKPFVARPPENMVVYLQPMDCKNPIQNKKNERAAIASCMRHGYIFQLQTHKLIGLE